MPDICSNVGCNKKFDERTNSPTSCRFHSGAAIFADVKKGYSCCDKRVYDFDAFLKITGCSEGPHTIRAPAAKKDGKENVEAAVLAPVSSKGGVETYSVGSTPSMSSTSLKKKPAEAVETPKIREQDLNDPSDTSIEEGTKCKRNGCLAIRAMESRTDAECEFHSGVAIFHEGSKSWSCCSRKVLEFDEFLKIKGCMTGRHRFLDTTMVNCRTDWYQTQTHVMISLFAKKASSASTAKFSENSIRVEVFLPNGQRYIYETELSQPIIPEDSKMNIFGTKVEIFLCKANGISWASIEPNNDLRSWSTFGVQGGVGSVGAKSAVVAADSLMYAS